jgi:uncharacterized glyoxalase superfamily protein PhnB
MTNDLYPICAMFTSRDMKKSVPFYRDTLGFQMKESWPNEEEPMWASMVLDRQSIMLGAAMDPAATETMCGDADAQTVAYFKKCAEDFKKNKSGVGFSLYIVVPDVDAFHDRVLTKGARPLTKPTSQFYGLRDFHVEDPDGYKLIFYTPIKMQSCQSCGMPLKDSKPGDMYCGYCTDSNGKLKPYESIFEGTVTGYFMGMQKMARHAAEQAAREHLKKMPAWKNR